MMVTAVRPLKSKVALKGKARSLNTSELLFFFCFCCLLVSTTLRLLHSTPFLCPLFPDDTSPKAEILTRSHGCPMPRSQKSLHMYICMLIIHDGSDLRQNLT